MTPPGSLLKRIRIATSDDIDRLYDLLQEFHHYAAKASGVETLIIKCEIGDGIYHGLDSAWQAWEEARSPSPDSFLWEVVRRLGFEREKEEKWVKGLTWMDPGVIAETNAAQVAGDRRQTSAYQRTLFAHYAAAILIAQCPYITHLVYEEQARSNSPLVDFLRRNNYDLLPQRYLQHLREVTLLPTTNYAFGDDRFYIRMDVLAQFHMFHRLPALKRFATFAIEPNNRIGFERTFTPCSSGLTKLSVTHSVLPGSVTAALIRLPRALEEFTCTTGGRASSDGAFYGLSSETIGRALWCQRKTLLKLDLDLVDHVLDRFEDRGIEDDKDEEDGRETEGHENAINRLPWDRGVAWGKDAVKTRDLETGRVYGSTIGSLHDFERLTHLSIGIQMLFGPSHWSQEVNPPFRLVDALPPSLESLLIRGYKRGETEEYDEFIDEFLAAREERLPKLSVIRGMEETISSAKDVEHPDKDADELWESPSFSEDWEEW